MPVSNRHILEQGATLAALGKVAISAFQQQRSGAPASTGLPSLPGPSIETTVEPRSAALVKDYIRHVGGEPSNYKGVLPPHFFPQWGFGLGGQVLNGLPYPIARVLNGGCNLEVRGPIPANEPLHVSARLESIDDDGRRAVLQQRVVTGTASSPEALIADMFAIVPLGGGKSKGDKPKNGAAKKKKKDTPRVPSNAREIARWRLGPKAGLDFAKLTGDFNPIHWVPPAARASGFPNVILHGFGSMARAIEGVNRAVFAGNPARMKKWECRFTKPLVLPHTVGLYLLENDVFVGDAQGGPAYLVGNFDS